MVSARRCQGALQTIFLVAILSGQVNAQVFTDNFDDNTTGPLWSAFNTATGPFVSETNGRVEFYFPVGTVVPGGGQNGFYTGSYHFLCTLHGDFDVQLDYSLESLNMQGTAVQIWVGQSFPLIQVVRHTNSYLGGVASQQNGLSTTDASGAFRLTRTGNVGAAYYLQAGGWSELGSGPVLTDDFGIFFGAYTFQDKFTGGGPFGGDFLSAVDNFQVNQGTLICPGPPATPPPTATPVLPHPVVSDDFNDNTISPAWSPILFGTGPTISEVNQQLEINIPATSQLGPIDPSVPPAILAGYASTGSLSGDFDVRVDYKLLTWPPANTIAVGFLISNPVITLWRSSSPDGENYGGQPPVPTTDQAGTLRITRCGSGLAGYYLNAGAWVQLLSNTGVAGDVPIDLVAATVDPAFDQTVKVAFDNFTVNQSQVDCPSICGDGVVHTGEQCDDGNLVAGDGCDGNCLVETTITATVPSGGGTVATANTSVTSPNPGTVSIFETSATEAPPEGFAFAGREVIIHAPQGTAATPLVLVFDVDASVIPLGTDETNIEISKDGATVPTCTGASGVASPDPCVANRVRLDTGDIELTVLSSTASRWAVTGPLCAVNGMTKPKLTIGKLKTPPGDDTLNFQGTFTVPFPFNPPLDPLTNGLRLQITNVAGSALDVTIPGGAFTKSLGRGWKVNARRTTWTYSDKTKVPIGGIFNVVVQDKSKSTPGLVKLVAKGKFGAYSLAASSAAATGRALLNPPTGQCGEAAFVGPAPASHCSFNAKRGTLSCK